MQGNLLHVSALAKTQLYLFEQYILERNERWCYHTQFSYHLQIKHLSLPLFHKAVRSVLDRHPVLKTVMLLDDPEAVRQAVNPHLRIQVGYEDISHLPADSQAGWLQEFLRNDRNQPFEVYNQQQPLFRSYLIKRGHQNLQFVLAFHHAIWDGWSLAVLLKEIFAFYQVLKEKPTENLPPASYDYREFIQNEAQIRQSPEAKAFWRRHLRHHQPFVPVRRENSSKYNDYQPGVRLLAAELSANLLQVQRRLQVTMKAIFIGLFIRMVQEETCQAQTTIGVVTNGRSVHLTNPLATLGLLWNLAPLCVAHEPDDTRHFREVNRLLTDVSAFGSYPLQDIAEAQGTPELFHAAFNFINFEGANLLPADSDIEFLEIGGLDKFHFPLHLLVGKNPFNKDISLVLNYDTRCYSGKEIEAKLNRYVHRLMHLCLPAARQTESYSTLYL